MGATLYDVDPEAQPLLYDLTAVERILRVDAQGEHEVIENPDAMPRARLHNRFRVAPSDRIFGHWKRGDVDFRSEVLLERDPGLVGMGIPWPEALPARIVADLPERVVIEVDAPEPALLVLADSFYPGWTAEVQPRGEAGAASGASEVPILRANGVHRAVVVEPGPQRVVFRYRPQSLERGALLSGASLLVLAAVLAAGFWRGRSW
jgi:hypothetical protein